MKRRSFINSLLIVPASLALSQIIKSKSKKIPKEPVVTPCTIDSFEIGDPVYYDIELKCLKKFDPKRSPKYQVFYGYVYQATTYLDGSRRVDLWTALNEELHEFSVSNRMRGVLT